MTTQEPLTDSARAALRRRARKMYRRGMKAGRAGRRPDHPAETSYMAGYAEGKWDRDWALVPRPRR